MNKIKVRNLLVQVFPDLSDDATITYTVNNPALLPGGGSVALEKRIVHDAEGNHVFLCVGRVVLRKEYVFYCEA